MCGQYIIRDVGGNFTTGENIHVEISPASGNSIAIKRIRVTDVNVNDVITTIRVKRETVAGTGTTSTITPIRKHVSFALPTSTVKVRSGTNTFTLGTVTDTLMSITTNMRRSFEWIARDHYDMLWSGANVILAITLEASATGGSAFMEVDFVE